MRMTMRMLACALAMVLAPEALAQATYPTGAAGVKASGVVPLQCNASNVNCVPVTAANPLPVTASGSGGTADQVQGAQANGATFTTNPLPAGCYASATAPSAVSAGQVARTWCGLQGGLASFVASSNGATIAAVAAPADGVAGQNGLAVQSQLMGFNGATWDRLLAAGPSSDGAATTQSGLIVGRAYQYYYNAGVDQMYRARGDGTGAYVVATPTAAAANAIVPVATSAVAGSLVVKASAGNLYRASITTGGSAGYLMGFNATSAPADGAVTPLLCRVVAANSTLTLSFAEMPSRFGTGITLVFSTTGCFTKTVSATAYIEASAL
jgi:hypothetical protein